MLASVLYLSSLADKQLGGVKNVAAHSYLPYSKCLMPSYNI